MDNVEFREAVDNHFRFMDKDGSEEIDFKEFAESTIDAADQKLSCYADEQYAKKFGMEIYMFLALCGRNKALKQFERDEAKAYEPGNELLPFFQFERLMKSSQAVFMPFELYAPEDDSLTGQRRAARRPSSATRKKEAAQTASAINSAAKSVFTEFSSSSFSSSSSASSASVVREDNSLFNEQALSNDNNNDNNNGQNAASSPTLQIEPRTFDVEDEDNEDGNLSTPASATMVDLNDNNDGLGQLISATESMSNSDVGGNVDGSGGGGGGGSSKPKHRASQKVGSNNSNEGYEELWGLGSSGISGSFGSEKITKEIVKEIEQGFLENKRAWAIRRRAEIIKSQKSVKLPQHSPTKLNDKIENLTGGKTKLGATNYKLTTNKKSEKRNSKLPTIIRKS
jgi:hypothetical protein